MKRCNHCHEEKPLEEFGKLTKSPDGHSPRCKICQRKMNRDSYSRCDKEKHRSRGKKRRLANIEAHRKYHRDYMKRYRKNNPRSAKRAQLKHHYGITLEQYEELLEEQDGKCKICGHEPQEGERALDVDHCHDEGHIRGILCSSCNAGLGHFQDRPDLLLKAIEYLEHFKPISKKEPDR